MVAETMLTLQKAGNKAKGRVDVDVFQLTEELDIYSSPSISTRAIDRGCLLSMKLTESHLCQNGFGLALLGTWTEYEHQDQNGHLRGCCVRSAAEGKECLTDNSR